MRARYGATVWAPDPDAVSDEVGCEPLADAARPAVGVEARAVGVVEPDLEVALVLAEHDAIVVGDVIHVGADGPTLSPDMWHDDTTETHEWFLAHGRETVHALLTPPPALLLTGHAPALSGDAVARFAASLAAPEG